MRDEVNINLTVVDCFKRKPASTRSIRSPSSACSGGGLSHCAGPVDVRCSGTVAAMVSINVAQAARREAAARAAVKAAALRQLAKAEMGPASALSGGAAYMPIYSPEGCAVGQDRIQGLTYVPDFVPRRDEAALIDAIDAASHQRWVNSSSGRRIANFGGRPGTLDIVEVREACYSYNNRTTSLWDPLT
mmetsp:Transcript_19163/g.57858  ORF Transcript_19163/g.57858 Transcript_19163/m.57858 type:complete len:189 (-) Transcript_19163:229-795(-)